MKKLIPFFIMIFKPSLGIYPKQLLGYKSSKLNNLIFYFTKVSKLHNFNKNLTDKINKFLKI